MSSAVVNEVIAAFPDLPITLIGGPTEAADADRIAGHYSGIVNKANRLSLSESVQIIRNSQVLLSGDTGMMHIAAAVGTPTITIWGCTRPSLGMAAWMPATGSQNILPEGRGHRPCSKLGNRCRHGKHRSEGGCTQHVSAQHVIEAIQGIVN